MTSSWRDYGRRTRVSLIASCCLMILSLVNLFTGRAQLLLLIAIPLYLIWIVVNVLLDRRAIRKIKAEARAERDRYEAGR